MESSCSLYGRSSLCTVPSMQMPRHVLVRSVKQNLHTGILQQVMKLNGTVMSGSWTGNCRSQNGHLRCSHHDPPRLRRMEFSISWILFNIVIVICQKEMRVCIFDCVIRLSFVSLREFCFVVGLIQEAPFILLNCPAGPPEGLRRTRREAINGYISLDSLLFYPFDSTQIEFKSVKINWVKIKPFEISLVK